MDAMALLGLGAPLAGSLAFALGRSLVLHARIRLVRAAAELPAGVQVEGRDSAGCWVAQRPHPSSCIGRGQ
jgi:hypothetical protein